jgi:hypothetical protein
LSSPAQGADFGDDLVNATGKKAKGALFVTFEEKVKSLETGWV